MVKDIRQRKPGKDDADTGHSQGHQKQRDHVRDTSFSVYSVIKWSLVMAVLVIAAVVTLIPSPIDPHIITEIYPPPHFNGTLTPNNELQKAERLFENQITGPESFAMKDDNLYTGTADGKILQINTATWNMKTLAHIGQPPCGGLHNEPRCGRPLGLRFDESGDLIVADAYLGLHAVDVQTGKVTELISGDQVIHKHDPNFFNDLDFHDGDIYFTDSSKKWSRRDVPSLFLEGVPDGRLIRFNRKTRETEEVLSKLRFANGIQRSHDGSFLLVAETLNCRILRYELEGEKKGTHSVFAENLPGFPDNIRRSSTGGYWVSLAAVRRAGSFSAFDFTAKRPWMRSLVAKLVDGWSVIKMLPQYGLILELDDAGQIVRSLHDPSGKTIPSVSEVHDEDGVLYLGSFLQPYLGRLDIRKENDKLLKKRDPAKRN